MRERMQRVLGRLTTKKATPAQRTTAHESKMRQPESEMRKEDWDMSPQDALQVGIVARYK